MKIAELVASQIERFPNGYVFTYSNFSISEEKKEAVIKTLNRMVSSSQIVKLSKGRFYKPEITQFGNIKPSVNEVVKDLLNENGKITGYLTTYSIYNKLGLSSQVTNTIQIGKNYTRPSFKRERYTISFVQQKNIITKKNIPLLQLLDSIRYIKKIPDSSVANSCKRLLSLLKKLSDLEKENIIKLALKYPPSTRALLGALLDELLPSSKCQNSIKSLYKTLNPITKYKISGANKSLSSCQKWNIV